jgi:hypothetical protein
MLFMLNMIMYKIYSEDDFIERSKEEESDYKG